tara:strand:- start:949 stop:1350 length:402 start_codon:yes stop_codon:yes gene_type:complete
MYCLGCRSLHRERSRGDKVDLPLCEKTNGKKCEIIQGWIDEEGVRHTEPFQLHPSNHLPFEMYNRTTQLSELSQFTWQKNDKSYQGYFPSLSALEFVLENFLPDEYKTPDELDLMIEKITLIHSLKMDNMLRA